MGVVEGTIIGASVIEEKEWFVRLATVVPHGLEWTGSKSHRHHGTNIDYFMVAVALLPTP
ncbi:hypothetical protein SUNI508_12701 [Seiridium unicorne]|uniref:Uncharacterized protein n=1 Tax=Seiridium unicorne TaxID=138068 RepID=A0ABR2VGM0_9PEZI